MLQYSPIGFTWKKPPEKRWPFRHDRAHLEVTENYLVRIMELVCSQLSGLGDGDGMMKELFPVMYRDMSVSDIIESCLFDG